MDGKNTRKVWICSGTGCSCTVSSVITPSVPAEPMKLHHSRAVCTSSLDSTYATARGGRTSGKFSSRPRCSSTDGLVLILPVPNRACSCSMALFIFCFPSALPFAPFQCNHRNLASCIFLVLAELWVHLCP